MCFSQTLSPCSCQLLCRCAIEVLWVEDPHRTVYLCGSWPRLQGPKAHPLYEPSCKACIQSGLRIAQDALSVVCARTMLQVSKNTWHAVLNCKQHPLFLQLSWDCRIRRYSMCLMSALHRLLSWWPSDNSSLSIFPRRPTSMVKSSRACWRQASCKAQCIAAKAFDESIDCGQRPKMPKTNGRLDRQRPKVGSRFGHWQRKIHTLPRSPNAPREEIEGIEPKRHAKPVRKSNMWTALSPFYRPLFVAPSRSPWKGKKHQLPSNSVPERPKESLGSASIASIAKIHLASTWLEYDCKHWGCYTDTSLEVRHSLRIAPDPCHKQFAVRHDRTPSKLQMSEKQ